MKQKKRQNDEVQEHMGCCPCMFSAYRKFKESSDVK